MRKLISAICAVFISIGTLGSVEVANAAPMTFQKPVEAATNNPNIEKVRHRDRWDRRWDRRYYRRHNRWDRGRHYGWDRRYYNRRWDRRWDRRYYRRYDRPRYYRSYDGYYGNPYYRRSGVSVIFDF
ncbi:hypothetical protein CU102_00540 [Phyllobacterium brassicacearum]|uniref:BA14K family protein n=1 Tax=Phyllobacterium brassicacearum TaxID=314235 RepID=A0A2P7BVU7_9HYPH|nr:hypothetical protein [Phyllobacterium brassicacearum]PSH70584.1 hypothetical protein CU102_00540 [Phyllobacterium brassicacearum]TDQ35959.1 hypothetical protein DEV91_101445 [Phyllobacterium brassicacearum]